MEFGTQHAAQPIGAPLGPPAERKQSVPRLLVVLVVAAFLGSALLAFRAYGEYVHRDRTPVVLAAGAANGRAHNSTARRAERRIESHYVASDIQAQLHLLHSYLKPGERVSNLAVSTDGTLTVIARQGQRAKAYTGDDPRGVFVAFTPTLASNTPIDLMTVTADAPRQVMLGATADGKRKAMTVTSLELAENPAQAGTLIWTARWANKTPGVFYADADGSHVRTTMKATP